jgi:hypothetical protein
LLSGHSFGRKFPILQSAKEMNVLQKKIDSLNVGFKDLSKFSRFNVSGTTYGYLQPKFVIALESYPEIFQVTRATGVDGLSSVDLTQTLQRCSLKDRSDAVATALQDLREKGVVKGWRDELFPVVSEFGQQSEPALLIERACYPWFGIRGYGLHVNGYTVESNSDGKSVSHYWVAKRALTKSQYPGALDSLVAGAIPFGVNSIDNLAKEGFEEAKIPPEIMKKHCVPTGALSYIDKDENGNLKRDFLLTFDFNTPHSFVPSPNDGEVESFRLMPIEWVLDEILKEEDAFSSSSTYKPNCVIIIVDFLIRRGIIAPDSPGYFRLVGSLRGHDCA